MGLLYAEEHVTCFNYDNGYLPVIEIVAVDKDREFEYLTHDHKLLFVNKGTLVISSGNRLNEKVSFDTFTFLPSLSLVKYKALEDSQVVIFRIREHIKLCDRFSLEKLKEEAVVDIKPEGIVFLKANSVMKDFLRSLSDRYTDGLRCFYYSNLKVQEVFFILRAYYRKEELACLFSSLLSSDIQFADAIYQNYLKVRTVKDLAESVNYSLSGFEKRFKKTFGVSAGSWMNRKRAMQIYHELNCSSKAFKTISSEYGFSSPSHFNDYCKTQFGDTPGGIRQTKKTS